MDIEISNHLTKITSQNLPNKVVWKFHDTLKIEKKLKRKFQFLSLSSHEIRNYPKRTSAFLSQWGFESKFYDGLIQMIRINYRLNLIAWNPNFHPFFETNSSRFTGKTRVSYGISISFLLEAQKHLDREKYANYSNFTRKSGCL